MGPQPIPGTPPEETTAFNSAGIGAETGLRRFSMPIDTGQRTAGIGDQNGVAGLVFDPATDEFWRTNAIGRFWESWSGGDVVFRMMCEQPFSGVPLDVVRWRFGYVFLRDGVQLAGDPAYTYVVQDVDVSAVVTKTPYLVDFVIPEADIDVEADAMAWELTRLASATEDTHANNVYLFDVAFRWNGPGIPVVEAS